MDESNKSYLWGNTHAPGTFPSMSQTYKSIFDPSPAGYRVAPQEIWWNFTTTHGPVTSVAQMNIGASYNFGHSFCYQGTKTGPTHFYAACAFRSDGSVATSYTLGTYGDWWCSTSDGKFGGLRLDDD